MLLQHPSWPTQPRLLWTVTSLHRLHPCLTCLLLWCRRSNLLTWTSPMFQWLRVTHAALAPVVEDIAPAPSVFHAEQAHVDVCIASAPAVTYASSASSSAPTPDTDLEEWTAKLRSFIREPAAERMRLQQKPLQTEPPLSFSLKERLPARLPKRQTQEVSCGLCTRWQTPAQGGI